VSVKICGITRLSDAVMAQRAGADYVGAILSQGYGRSVPVEVAATYPRETGLPLVAVTVDETLEGLVEIAAGAGATVLQLHGAEPPERLAALRAEGDWELWKALRVRTAEEVEEALEGYGSVADGILLDGWHPEHRGGSGVRFPWDLVEPLRDRFPSDLRFIAAGGMQADNVAEAVRRLTPDVVDVSSGVEITTGIKDAGRVRAFIENARLTS
jgi:phosphoribosylanthranilate isomerase